MMDPTISGLVADVLLPRDRFFHEATADNTGLSDLVTAANHANTLEGAGSRNDAADLVMARLGHIPVNPNDPGNTHFLTKSYVYAVEPLRDGGRPHVNSSPKAALAFLDRLVALARNASERSLTAHHSDRRHKILTLTGPRGTGKTFFVNHLFSSFSSALDQKKVVWIRLNLIADHGFDGDLLKWVRAQISKVMLRYYQTDSEFEHTPSRQRCDIVGHLLDQWISESFKDADDRERFRDIVNGMRQVFCQLGADEDISPSLCNDLVCREIYRFCRMQGYAFIVVFDGFDRMDSDTLHRDRFTTLSGSLRQLSSGAAEFGACFVVVCRSQTFKAILNGNGLRPHFDETNERLGSPSFYDIVEKRLSILESWFVEASKIANTAPAGLAALEYTRNFKANFQTRYNNGEYRDLEETLFDNNRAKIQMLMLEFRDYVQKQHGTGYRFIELLVKGGYVYPPVFYRYRLITPDRMECDYEDRDSRIMYDSRFLPIVTRPPVPRGRNETIVADPYVNRFSILHGVRLLQMLELWTKFVQEDARIDNLSIEELCDALQCIFGYDKTVTRALIYEYESYECIEVERHEIVSGESDYDTIRLMPKGQRIIQDFLFDIAYLSLCSMRTFFSSAFWSKSYFRLGSLGRNRSEQYAERLENWILMKISNGLLLANLLSSANDMQIKSILQTANVSGLPDRIASRILPSGVDEFGNIMQNMNARISREIESIYESADRLQKSGIRDMREKIRRKISLCASYVK